MNEGTAPAVLEAGGGGKVRILMNKGTAPGV